MIPTWRVWRDGTSLPAVNMGCYMYVINTLFCMWCVGIGHGGAGPRILHAVLERRTTTQSIN